MSFPAPTSALPEVEHPLPTAAVPTALSPPTPADAPLVGAYDALPTPLALASGLPAPSTSESSQTQGSPVGSAGTPQSYTDIAAALEWPHALYRRLSMPSRVILLICVCMWVVAFMYAPVSSIWAISVPAIVIFRAYSCTLRRSLDSSFDDTFITVLVCALLVGVVLNGLSPSMVGIFSALYDVVFVHWQNAKKDTFIFGSLLSYWISAFIIEAGKALLVRAVAYRALNLPRRLCGDDIIALEVSRAHALRTVAAFLAASLGLAFAGLITGIFRFIIFPSVFGSCCFCVMCLSKYTFTSTFLTPLFCLCGALTAVHTLQRNAQLAKQAFFASKPHVTAVLLPVLGDAEASDAWSGAIVVMTDASAQRTYIPTSVDTSAAGTPVHPQTYRPAAGVCFAELGTKSSGNSVMVMPWILLFVPAAMLHGAGTFPLGFGYILAMKYSMSSYASWGIYLIWFVFAVLTTAYASILLAQNWVAYFEVNAEGQISARSPPLLYFPTSCDWRTTLRFYNSSQAAAVVETVTRDAFSWARLDWAVRVVAEAREQQHALEQRHALLQMQQEQHQLYSDSDVQALLNPVVAVTAPAPAAADSVIVM